MCAFRRGDFDGELEEVCELYSGLKTRQFAAGRFRSPRDTPKYVAPRRPPLYGLLACKFANSIIFVLITRSRPLRFSIFPPSRLSIGTLYYTPCLKS